MEMTMAVSSKMKENGKLHKRYIVSNYKQEKTYLVNQGLEEGQTLAIVSK